MAQGLLQCESCSLLLDGTSGKINSFWRDSFGEVILCSLCRCRPQESYFRETAPQWLSNVLLQKSQEAATAADQKLWSSYSSLVQKCITQCAPEPESMSFPFRLGLRLSLEDGALAENVIKEELLMVKRNSEYLCDVQAMQKILVQLGELPDQFFCHDLIPLTKFLWTRLDVSHCHCCGTLLPRCLLITRSLADTANTSVVLCKLLCATLPDLWTLNSQFSLPQHRTTLDFLIETLRSKMQAVQHLSLHEAWESWLDQIRNFHRYAAFPENLFPFHRGFLFDACFELEDQIESLIFLYHRVLLVLFPRHNLDYLCFFTSKEKNAHLWRQYLSENSFTPPEESPPSHGFHEISPCLLLPLSEECDYPPFSPIPGLSPQKSSLVCPSAPRKSKKSSKKSFVTFRLFVNHNGVRRDLFETKMTKDQQRSNKKASLVTHSRHISTLRCV